MKQLIVSLFLFILPSIGWSHAAPRLEVIEKIMINKPPAQVWDLLKDFTSIQQWHPRVATAQLDGDNSEGSSRLLTLTDNNTIKQKLTEYDSDDMEIVYMTIKMSKVGDIDDGGKPMRIPVIPVNGYKSWLSLKAVDGGTEVRWRGKFFRAYYGKQHEPPKELNDDVAIKAITDFYQQGLAGLKQLLETK